MKDIELIKLYAQGYFEAMLMNGEYRQAMGTPLEGEFITRELSRLEAFKIKADQLYQDGIVNVSEGLSSVKHRTAKNPKEYEEAVEYKRLESGYYESNPVPGGMGYGSTQAKVYAEHWIMKPYLDGLKANPVEAPKVIGMDGKDENPKPSELDLILAGENKFLEKVSMRIVYDHFKKLAEKDTDLGAPCLTNEQLYLFLKKGFLGESAIPKQEFSNPDRRKGDIIRVFYWFYYNMREDGFNGKYTREKYIDLIFDCFDNKWSRASIAEFFKPKNPKKKGKQ